MKVLFEIRSNNQKANEFFEMIKGRNVRNHPTVFEIDISEDQIKVVEEHLVKQAINYSYYSWTTLLLSELQERVPDLAGSNEFLVEFYEERYENSEGQAEDQVDKVIDGWIDEIRNLKTK